MTVTKRFVQNNHSSVLQTLNARTSSLSSAHTVYAELIIYHLENNQETTNRNTGTLKVKNNYNPYKIIVDYFKTSSEAIDNN